MGKKTDAARVATADFETDPFERGMIPEPFAWGFFDGDGYADDWQDDPEQCVASLFRHIAELVEPHLIYFHNGGKFDFYMRGFLQYLRGDIRIVNGRILQAFYTAPNGITHEFRDSYAAIPVPLREYRKDDIDYRKLARHVRHRHRAEILRYQRTDCIALHELVTAYRAEFGDVLTVGSAAMRQFGTFHKVERANQSFDRKFRPFYFGGRNQCFRSGIIEGPYKIFDINSQYPFSMANFEHPVSVRHDIGLKLGPATMFAVVEADNYGALPVRTKNGLDFNTPNGAVLENEHGKMYGGKPVFYASIHELRAGEETGSLRIRRVLKTFDFPERMKFGDFVDHFYSARSRAREAGDTLRTIFYKLVLNSAYGKFAQDPENYYEWRILPAEELIEQEYEERPNPVTGEAEQVPVWQLAEMAMDYALWRKPVKLPHYYNVATAASITGAARSVLLRGIASSTDPLYCDTDSLICRELTADIDPKRLGAWKYEGGGDRVAIAGKKLYAVMDGAIAGVWRDHAELVAMQCVKHASKGANIEPGDIVRAAGGDVVRWESDRPAFKLSGRHQFIARNIRRTAGNEGLREPALSA